MRGRLHSFAQPSALRHQADKNPYHGGGGGATRDRSWEKDEGDEG